MLVMHIVTVTQFCQWNVNQTYPVTGSVTVEMGLFYSHAADTFMSLKGLVTLASCI